MSYLLLIAIIIFRPLILYGFFKVVCFQITKPPDGGPLNAIGNGPLSVHAVSSQVFFNFTPETLV